MMCICEIYFNIVVPIYGNQNENYNIVHNDTFKILMNK